MDTNQQLIELGIRLGEVAVRSSASFISARVRKAKASQDTADQIIELEAIIDDLMADKLELTEISRKYEELTSFNKISEEDVSYITDNLIPVIEEFLTEATALSTDPNAMDELNNIIGVIKPIVSLETITILQMFGFNFRDAVGQPLTELVKKIILKKVNSNIDKDITLQTLKFNTEYSKIVQDEESFNRYNGK